MRVNITGGPLAYHYQFEEIYIHYGMDNDYGSEHRINNYAFPAEVSEMFTKFNARSRVPFHENNCHWKFTFAVNFPSRNVSVLGALTFQFKSLSRSIILISLSFKRFNESSKLSTLRVKLKHVSHVSEKKKNVIMLSKFLSKN